jgi:hypothetical protein
VTHTAKGETIGSNREIRDRPNARVETANPRSGISLQSTGRKTGMTGIEEYRQTDATAVAS